MGRKKNSFGILCLFLINLSVCVSLVNGASTSDRYLFPLMDTSVFEEAESNLGGHNYLIIGYLYEPHIYGFGSEYTPGNCETYLYFNIASLDLSQIKSIILVFPGDLGQIGTDFQIQVFKVTENWAEYGITWDNKPLVDKLISTGDTSNPRFDITNEVKQDPFNTICLKGFQAHSTYFYSNSREKGNQDFQDLPHLIVSTTQLNIFFLAGLIISLIALAIFIYSRIRLSKRS